MGEEGGQAMRRLLSVGLAALLLLGSLGLPALANEGVPDGQHSEKALAAGEDGAISPQAVIEVSTFSALKSALDGLAQGNAATLRITADIAITQTLSVAGDVALVADDGVRLYRDASFANAPLFIVDGDASLRVGTSVSIDGDRVPVTTSLPESADPASAVVVQGVLVIDGGFVENHVSAAVPAISVRNAGQVTIAGGGVRNNSLIAFTGAANGGAALRVKSGGTVLMGGGSISGNTAHSDGGAVVVAPGGSFVLADGDVSDNVCEGGTGGGAFYIDAGAHFKMTGGAIRDNQAVDGSGGGILYTYAEDSQALVESGSFEVYAGSFTGNYATGAGGALFISSEYAHTELTDVYIAENSAQAGGGLYVCPTGDVEFYVTNGTAIVENTASYAGSMLDKRDGGTYSMDDRILGGGRQYIYADPNSDRYQPGRPELDPSAYQGVSGPLLLHADASPESIALARAEAKVLVTGNSAGVVGGGIGNNGVLVFGKRGLDKTLTVVKKWEGEIPENIVLDIDLIRVDASGNEVVLETFPLSEDNGWTFEGGSLPGEYSYRVEEKTQVPGYTVEYVESEQGTLVTIEIHNKAIAPPPEEEEDPPGGEEPPGDAKTPPGEEEPPGEVSTPPESPANLGNPLALAQAGDSGLLFGSVCTVAVAILLIGLVGWAAVRKRGSRAER